MIRFFITHSETHPDEALAMLEMRIYGEEKYPGARKAKVVFVEGGHKLIPHQPDCLYFGVSSDAPDGDKFDEHAHGNRPRKEGHSSASLVACDLGIQDLPELKLLLQYVTDEDLHGRDGFMGLATMAKLLYRENNQEVVFQWITLALEARINEQRDLLAEENLKLFDEAVKSTVIIHKGKELKIGLIETDNDMAGKCSRTRGFGLLIQRNSDGHVQIFPRKQNHLYMKDIVRLLRLEELDIVGFNSRVDWKDLESENSSDCGVWYIHPESGIVMNGSKTHNEVPVTKIELERILHLVKLAFDDSTEFKKCSVCTHSPRKGALQYDCPFYSAGLLHCRSIRFKQAQELKIEKQINKTTAA